MVGLGCLLFAATVLDCFGTGATVETVDVEALPMSVPIDRTLGVSAPPISEFDIA